MRIAKEALTFDDVLLRPAASEMVVVLSGERIIAARQNATFAPGA